MWPVKPFRGGEMMPGPPEEAPANSVPAAAVRQEERVLFGIIGRKGHVGGPRSVVVPRHRSTVVLRRRRGVSRGRGEARISRGAVKCLEMRRNIEREGQPLAFP